MSPHFTAFWMTIRRWTDPTTSPTSFPGGDDPVANAFAAAFMTAYNILSDSSGAAGYDSMKLLAHAIETAAGGMGGDGKIALPDADAILAALVNVQDYRGATAISHFDENRLAVKQYSILTIQDGMAGVP